MIVNNTHPERSLYFYGGYVLKALDTYREKEMDLISIHQSISKNKKMSVNVLLLTLDWLYLLGLIKFVEGKIIRCS